MTPCVLEWSTATSSALGATLLALNHPRWSKYGWFLFLIANVLAIVWAYVAGHPAFVFQNVVFLFTSVFGVVRWFRPQDAP